MSLVTVITGAGSGIGRAVALAVAKKGHRLVLAGRRREALQETASAVDADCHIAPCDVTVEADVARLFGDAATRFGRVDVLFNNAGVNGGGPFDEIPLSEWRRVLDTNLTGYFLCAQQAFRQMKRQHPQGGRIINNGSIAAQTPRPGSAPYAVSKHGVSGLTKAIALDGRPFGIACGQVDIGNAATDLSAGFSAGMPQADGSIRPEPTFDVAHAAAVIADIASLPLDTNMFSMTIAATQMPFIGRG